jgi:hypothetical protein
VTRLRPQQDGDELDELLRAILYRVDRPEGTSVHQADAPEPGGTREPVLGPRWLKLRIGRRGSRVSVGPRLFRLHLGGRSGIDLGRRRVANH